MLSTTSLLSISLHEILFLCGAAVALLIFFAYVAHNDLKGRSSC